MRYAGRCPRLLRWLWRRFSRVREPAFPVAGTPPQRGCDVECCREIGTRYHGGARFETESVITCGRTASPLTAAVAGTARDSPEQLGTAAPDGSRSGVGGEDAEPQGRSGRGKFPRGTGLPLGEIPS